MCTNARKVPASSVMLIRASPDVPTHIAICVREDTICFASHGRVIRASSDVQRPTLIAICVEGRQERERSMLVVDSEGVGE